MSQTADRYSKAIFELAKEQNSLEAIEGELTQVRELISKVEDFRQFLSNPLLSYEERSAVLKALFQGKISDLLYKFLLFITYKNRLDILSEMIQSFDNLYLSSTHQLRAYVTTASTLEKEDKVLVNQRLHDKFKCNMLTTWRIDPSIIGGFRIFVQGKVYDYSFKGQLGHFLQKTIQPV